MAGRTKNFTVEVRDYEAGETPLTLTTGQIEAQVQQLLDSEGADGAVIVEELPET